MHAIAHMTRGQRKAFKARSRRDKGFRNGTKRDFGSDFLSSLSFWETLMRTLSQSR